MKGKPYRGVLGCCWWGASSMHPDIVFACSILAGVKNAPARRHSGELLLKLCRYIFTIINYGIVYQPGSSKRVRPIGYVDADWTGDRASCKSMSSYIFLLNGSPISWSSKHQDAVALSSTKSEYVSLSRGVQQALWICSWLDEVDLGLGKDPLDILLQQPWCCKSL